MSILPFPIADELLQELPLSLQVLILADFIDEPYISSLLEPNLPRMSLYDLRTLKSSNKSITKALVDKEIRRRLNTNIYDQIIELLNKEIPLSIEYDIADIIRYTSNLEYMYGLYLTNPDVFFTNVVSNRHITMEFLEKHPDLIRDEMASNKAITQEYFINNIDKFGENGFVEFSENPNVTKDFLIDNYNEDITYSAHIATREFVNYDFLKKYMPMFYYDETNDLLDYSVFSKFNISFEELKLLVEEYRLDYSKASIEFLANKNASLEHIRNYFTEHAIDTKLPIIDNIVKNPNIDINFIIELFKYIENLSTYRSRGITTDYLKLIFERQAEKDSVRYRSTLTLTQAISIQDILKHPELPWTPYYINQRLDVTQTILEDFDYPYQYEQIEGNPNVSLGFVLQHDLRITHNGFTQHPNYVKLAESILAIN